MKQPLLWILAALVLIQAGWMAYDGTRALVLGDYVTPTTGPYAGQLGPWSKVVAAVGIEPRSTFMKSVFAVYGFAWLAILACFLRRVRGSWTALLLAAIGALWYLPFGTMLGAIQIGILCLPELRLRAKAES